MFEIKNNSKKIINEFLSENDLQYFKNTLQKYKPKMINNNSLKNAKLVGNNEEEYPLLNFNENDQKILVNLGEKISHLTNFYQRLIYETMSKRDFYINYVDMIFEMMDELQLDDQKYSLMIRFLFIFCYKDDYESPEFNIKILSFLIKNSIYFTNKVKNNYYANIQLSRSNNEINNFDEEQNYMANSIILASFFDFSFMITFLKEKLEGMNRLAEAEMFGINFEYIKDFRLEKLEETNNNVLMLNKLKKMLENLRNYLSNLTENCESIDTIFVFLNKILATKNDNPKSNQIDLLLVNANCLFNLYSLLMNTSLNIEISIPFFKENMNFLNSKSNFREEDLNDYYYLCFSKNFNSQEICENLKNNKWITVINFIYQILQQIKRDEGTSLILDKLLSNVIYSLIIENNQSFIIFETYSLIISTNQTKERLFKKLVKTHFIRQLDQIIMAKNVLKENQLESTLQLANERIIEQNCIEFCISISNNKHFFNQMNCVDKMFLDYFFNAFYNNISLISNLDIRRNIFMYGLQIIILIESSMYSKSNEKIYNENGVLEVLKIYIFKYLIMIILNLGDNPESQGRNLSLMNNFYKESEMDETYLSKTLIVSSDEDKENICFCLSYRIASLLENLDVSYYEQILQGANSKEDIDKCFVSFSNQVKILFSFYLDLGNRKYHLLEILYPIVTKRILNKMLQMFDAQSVKIGNYEAVQKYILEYRYCCLESRFLLFIKEEKVLEAIKSLGINENGIISLNAYKESLDHILNII